MSIRSLPRWAAAVPAAASLLLAGAAVPAAATGGTHHTEEIRQELPVTAETGTTTNLGFAAVLMLAAGGAIVARNRRADARD
ncbi:LPXTG cell wall anchor domain-containing protein [Streptomyces chilikensis]|uniref:LPXTG cell wall anchor domain-containing protein n=1 Tax=Streptomyces chilikensis TaxID=1194079 RepID=UPI00140E59CE|nr:LPXTG cell wall anchor domain-containing protein [Streptomyces chilikensis]